MNRKQEEDIRNTSKLLARNTLSRRRFLQTMFATGAGALAYGAAPLASVVAQGGSSATVDIANSFGRLNPVLSTAIGELTINNAVFNKVPALLAEAPTQEDDLTWTLSFRQGVMFHDGTEMKASDFKFTLDLIQNPDTASLFANFLTPIAGVDATGDYSARIHLNEPFGLLPERLFVMSVLPEATFNEMGMDRFGLAPVGTGPFVFQNMIAQDRVELARNPDYFVDGLPLLDSLIYREVPEASVRMANLVANQSDVMEQVPPESFDIFSQAPGIVAGSGPSTRRAFIAYNCTKPPLDDARVRQALSYAIDRQAIIDTVLSGKGLPGNGSSIPPTMDNYNADADKYNYDPDMARALLSDAGAEGIKLELMAGSLKFLADTVTLIKPMVEAVGIETEIRLIEVEAGYQFVFDRTFDTYTTWGNTSALGSDIDIHTRWIYGPFIGRGDTLFGWGPHNGDIFEQTHQTMNAAAASADADERRAGYDQVQATVVDEAVEFVLYWPDNLGAWRDNITGYVPPIDDVIEASHIAKS
ncbi:MAG: ABC transporter substrate-binding protein [Chloroflexi bacterium]|nr:ABC transporter substrate-binding protein [Chloroflexota bacterium]